MSNNADSLGDRMKGYEDVYNHKLIRRLPVIIRLDGRAFHTLTQGMNKPFDERFSKCMLYTTIQLVKEIQGAIFGYTQSDEISILLKDWTTHTTEAWFDDKIQKMVSVSASMATRNFLTLARFQFGKAVEEDRPLRQRALNATFDSRVFNLPYEEVNNYFLWRQSDATRNSVNAVAQSEFSHKELQGINVTNVKIKLRESKGIDWDSLPQWQKMGYGIKRVKLSNVGIYLNTEVTNVHLPLFSQDPSFIESIMTEEEESNATT